MALSAFERKILNEIPVARKTPIVVKYVMGIARQLRPAVRSKYSMREITEHILSTIELVRVGNKDVLVLPGADEKKYVLFINMPDQPFIVDTCRIHLRSLGATNISGFNAILGLHRNENGEIVSVDEPRNQLESVLRFEVEGEFQISPEEMEEYLREQFELARVIVKDFKKMTTEKTLVEAYGGLLRQKFNGGDEINFESVKDSLTTGTPPNVERKFNSLIENE